MAAKTIRRTVKRPKKAGPAKAPSVPKKRLAGRLETILARLGFRYVAGVDEVGRGALAGPLVAAAVVLDVQRLPEGVCDSKMLTAAEREELARVVLASAVATSFVVVDPLDIDDDGLHVSNLAALERAVSALRPRPEYVISDCFPLDGLRLPRVGLPKADALSAAVASASIVAKVSRDAMMSRLEIDYPGYAFSRHKGYGSEEHWAAIRALGPSPVHRRSFRGVASWQPSLAGL
jgi:ribonuclease HII